MDLPVCGDPCCPNKLLVDELRAEVNNLRGQLLRYDVRQSTNPFEGMSVKPEKLTDKDVKIIRDKFEKYYKGEVRLINLEGISSSGWASMPGNYAVCRRYGTVSITASFQTKEEMYEYLKRVYPEAVLDTDHG